MSVLCISNHKGGVGKTTTVVNLGAGLVQLGKKVLLVDLDPQANLTQSLHLQKHQVNNFWKGGNLVPVKASDNLDVVISSSIFAKAEINLLDLKDGHHVLKKALDRIKDKYDYVVIDTPPNLGLITINALVASDDIVIPLQPHYLPLEGLNTLLQVVKGVQEKLNKNLTFRGVLITKFNRATKLNKGIVRSVEKSLGLKHVFITKIRENIALAEAPFTGSDIFAYQDQIKKPCNGAEDYLNFSKEIIKMN